MAAIVGLPVSSNLEHKNKLFLLFLLCCHEISHLSLVAAKVNEPRLILRLRTANFLKQSVTWRSMFNAITNVHESFHSVWPV